MKYEDKLTAETAASILDSCILFCDVIIAGKGSAVGLKYDEENMFAPMIVFLERDASASALVFAAENLGVPVVKNVALAKNLSSYGKAGATIPELSYRDVSLALARIHSSASGILRSGGTAKYARRDSKKSRQGLPLSIPRPLSVEMGAALFALISEEPGSEKLLAEPLNAVRKRIIRLLGITIPPFRISRKKSLKSDEYRILFKGLEAGRGRLELGWYASASIQGEGPERRTIPEIMNNPDYIRAAAKAASSMLLRHSNEIIQRRAPELLGRDEVEAILDAAEEKYPVVTSEVKSLLSLGIIREILQSLVTEQVSIRHIAVILESLADWGSFGSATSDIIVEQIRQSLKRQICLQYTDEKLTLRVLTLEPKLENKFSEHNQDSSIKEELEELISSAVMKMDEKGFPPVILCSPKARAPVKEATRRKLPNLAVLSYLEIPPDISVVPLGEIRFRDKERNGQYP
jgi:flagellar biosynthesis protein FlhA